MFIVKHNNDISQNNSLKKNFIFEIKTKNGKSYLLTTDSEENRESWYSILFELKESGIIKFFSVSINPFQRKKKN